MSHPVTSDSRRVAAEAVYAAILKAQRDVGDVALCEALDLLAEGSGENRFRFAASVIRGTRLGRHAINDREALRRVAEFPAARRREAVGIVARQIAGPDADDARIDAVANRLRRKLRENKAGKLLITAAPIS
jgi:hypothetical protein